MFGVGVKILKFVGMLFVYLKVTSKLGCARILYYTLLKQRDIWDLFNIYNRTLCKNIFAKSSIGRKLSVHKTFRRPPGRLLNVLCTFSLRPVSTGEICPCKDALPILHDT